jgi:hypothetical protein
VSYNVLRYAPLAFANRLWKWLANSPPIYRTVPGNVLEQFLRKQSSPLMEMAGKQSSNLYDCVGDCAGTVLRKAVLTAYGNGWQTVLQFIGLCWGLCWSSSQESSPYRL